MPDDTPTTRTDNTRVQKRGQERRALLLSSAKKLIRRAGADKLSLAELSQDTGIPLSSVYHFYPQINDLYAALTRQFGEELSAYLLSDARAMRPQSWMEILEHLVAACASFYRANPGYAELLLSGKAPMQIKQTDREQDNALAQKALTILSNNFEFPAIPELGEKFFNCIEIVDLMLALDFMRHQEITDAGIKEAIRASRAYLACYLPEYLPLR